MCWLKENNARYSQYKNHETTRVKIQAMYVYRRIIWGEKKSITYSEFVFLALGIQHSIHMRHIVICGMPGSTIFFHIIS